MFFAPDDSFEIDQGRSSLGKRRHASGFLLEEAGYCKFSKAGTEHSVEMRWTTAALDMAEDGLADFLFKFTASIGFFHPCDEGAGIADSLGQDDDGIVPCFLETLVKQADDPLHVVEILWNDGDLSSAANRGGQGQIAGIAPHDLDQEATAMGTGRVTDFIDQFHNGIGGGINSDGHIRSSHVVINAGWNADHWQAPSGEFTGTRQRAIATDDNQAVNAAFLENLTGSVDAFGLVKSFAATGLKDGSSRSIMPTGKGAPSSSISPSNIPS